MERKRWTSDIIADIAVDDFKFVNCSLPVPAEDCPPRDHYLCRTTHACVPKEQVRMPFPMCHPAVSCESGNYREITGATWGDLGKNGVGSQRLAENGIGLFVKSNIKRNSMNDQ